MNPPSGRFLTLVYLGVGPFGVVLPCGVVALPPFRILGVEGVSGVMRGTAEEGVAGVRGATRGWGVEVEALVGGGGV